MSDPFKKFVEQMARLAVPEDDTEDNRQLVCGFMALLAV